MSEFFSRPDSAPTNAAEYTVSELSGALRRTVEDAFGNVRVRGEISGYRGPHSSGHAYFALKDDRSKLEAVIWKLTFQRLKFKPEEGMEVIASGRLTTFPGSSKYQIVIDKIEPAGAGALMALLEERKRRLQAEGVFDPAYKKPLPFMPRTIGVITSPTGAVIRDILHRIRDRFPLRVVVWPVRVQGDTSGMEVTAAVRGFNEWSFGLPVPRPDVLIIARGGGSLEDLWGFNDEGLARAVAASDIPIISAVGHETDWTLVDHAADMRAPTPTGAAEFAVPVKAELEATLASLGARLGGGLSRSIERKRTALRAAARVLPTPDALLADPRRRLDEVSARLARALTVNTERKRARFAAARLTPQTLERRIADGRRGLEAFQSRIDAGERGLMRNRRAQFERAAARVSVVPLERRRLLLADRLAAAGKRKDQAFVVKVEKLNRRLAQADRLLSSLSHKSVLERGFALVRNADGLVRSAAQVQSGERLELQFADGVREAIADGEAQPGAVPRPQAPPVQAAPEPARKPKPAPKTPEGQGSLF